VFGAVVFRARDHVIMPPPGDLAPARISKTLRDPVWDALYAPISGIIGRATSVLNNLQFLTIRRYLSLVFGVLIVLLLALALWQ
jgi:hydrogenase-4 component B